MLKNIFDKILTSSPPSPPLMSNGQVVVPGSCCLDAYMWPATTKKVCGLSPSSSCGCQLCWYICQVCHRLGHKPIIAWWPSKIWPNYTALIDRRYPSWYTFLASFSSFVTWCLIGGSSRRDWKLIGRKISQWNPRSEAVFVNEEASWNLLAVIWDQIWERHAKWSEILETRISAQNFNKILVCLKWSADSY